MSFYFRFVSSKWNTIILFYNLVQVAFPPVLPIYIYGLKYRIVFALISGFLFVYVSLLFPHLSFCLANVKKMLGSCASDSFFIYLLWLPWNPPFTKQETDKGHEQREMLKPNQERENRSPSQQGFLHFIWSVTSCAECLSVGPRSCQDGTGTQAGKRSQFWQRPDPRELAGRRPSAGLLARSSLLCASLCEKTTVESMRKRLPAHCLWSQVRTVTWVSQSRPKGSSLPSGSHTQRGVPNLSFCAGRGWGQTQDRGADGLLWISPAEGPLPCLEPAGLFLDKPLLSILGNTGTWSASRWEQGLQQKTKLFENCKFREERTLL